MVTETIDKTIRRIIVLVIVSFLLPVTFVVINDILIGIFSVKEFINQIFFSWQFPVFLGLFWVFGIYIIRRELLNIRSAIINKNQKRSDKSYKRVLLFYIVLSLLYSIIGAVVPYTTGFSLNLSLLSLGVSFCYIGISYVPFYILVLKSLDELYSQYYPDLNSKNSFSVRFKFRFSAFYSSFSGASLLIISACTIIWRMLEYPELGLTLSDAIFRLALIGFIVFIIQAMPNLFLAGIMIVDIRAIKEFVQKIASHDLNHTLHVSTRDGFGATAREISKMGMEYKSIIKSISENAQYLRNASTEFKNLASLMSESSSNLAASAEELASSMEEMSANIAVTSENATDSANINSQSTKQIQVGQQSMETTLKDIKEISAKVDLVQKIAGQTNLLAVNASIEASAAGEHGKGFAVIAREVRDLADKSKEAATEITDLAESTMLRSQDLKEKIDEIAGNSTNTAELAKNIATASKEQQNSSDQINSTVQSLNNNAQQLAASAEELSSSSQVLSEKAGYLEKIVEDFKI